MEKQMIDIAELKNQIKHVNMFIATHRDPAIKCVFTSAERDNLMDVLPILDKLQYVLFKNYHADYIEVTKK